MTKLMRNLEPVVESELREANKNHPLFASRHDGAAVIREEVEEAQQAMRLVEEHWKELWHDVKRDNYEYLINDIDAIKEHAMQLAGEAVQICAMCDKWKLGGTYDND